MIQTNLNIFIWQPKHQKQPSAFSVQANLWRTSPTRSLADLIQTTNFSSPLSNSLSTCQSHYSNKWHIWYKQAAMSPHQPETSQFRKPRKVLQPQMQFNSSLLTLLKLEIGGKGIKEGKFQANLEKEPKRENRNQIWQKNDAFRIISKVAYNRWVPTHSKTIGKPHQDKEVHLACSGKCIRSTANTETCCVLG